eukprot:9484412-Pyramimonas_sp.AAC.1
MAAAYSNENPAGGERRQPIRMGALRAGNGSKKKHRPLPVASLGPRRRRRVRTRAGRVEEEKERQGDQGDDAEEEQRRAREGGGRRSYYANPAFGSTTRVMNYATMQLSNA